MIQNVFRKLEIGNLNFIINFT